MPNTDLRDHPILPETEWPNLAQSNHKIRAGETAQLSKCLLGPEFNPQNPCFILFCYLNTCHLSVGD